MVTKKIHRSVHSTILPIKNWRKKQNQQIPINGRIDTNCGMLQSKENEQSTTPYSWLREFHKYSVEREKLSKIIYKFLWFYLNEVQTQTTNLLSYNSRWLLILERKLVTGHMRTLRVWSCPVSYLKDCYIGVLILWKLVEPFTFNVCIFGIYTSIKFYITEKSKMKD